MSQFGQPPLAAFLPLRAGQNLSDLPDKAAALTNLGTLSTSDIMLNSVPIGTIIPFWGNTAPVGYLPCNGQTVNSGTFPDLVTFLGGGSSQVLPDLRGEFLRGWDNGRGLDTGRSNRSVQTDAFQNITATLQTRPLSGGGFGSIWSAGGALTGTTGSGGSGVASVVAGGPAQNADSFTFDASRVARTSTETRPHNVSVLYCMKAYGALINTSTANMGNVLTELSQCTKLTQFGVNTGTIGYQKLPSGLIIQWGTGVATSGGTTVTHAIIFPTACLQVVIGVANGAVFGTASTNGAGTVSGFTAYSSVASLGTTYIAIGY